MILAAHFQFKALMTVMTMPNVTTLTVHFIVFVMMAISVMVSPVPSLR